MTRDHGSSSSKPASAANTRKGLGDRERVDRDAVERGYRGDDPPGADEAPGGLQPDSVGARGRDAPRACGVGAEREGHQAPGDGDRGSRAGAARDVTGRERVARRAVGRSRTHEPGGELVHVRRADDDRPRRLEARHDRGRCRGRTGRVRRTRGGRGQTGDRDVVLDERGHPPQRAPPWSLRLEPVRARRRVGPVDHADHDRVVVERGQPRANASRTCAHGSLIRLRSSALERPRGVCERPGLRSAPCSCGSDLRPSSARGVSVNVRACDLRLAHAASDLRPSSARGVSVNVRACDLRLAHAAPISGPRAPARSM